MTRLKLFPPERAASSGRTWQWDGCSLACAARRAALYHHNQLCRDVRSLLARHPPSRAQRGDPPLPSHFRVLVCALRALRVCAVRRTQRRGAPPLRAARMRVSADSRVPRRGEGERGTGTYHPTATEIHVRAYSACRPGQSDLRDVPRLARARPPRMTELTAQQRTWTRREGGLRLIALNYG